MSQFGLYEGASSLTMQDFEGDYMTQNGQFVQIFERASDPTRQDTQVAAIHLDKGQCVKKVK
jgi:hypothetical protein